MSISDFSNEELLLLSNSLALAISKELTQDDLLILAAFLTSLADNLALLAL